MFACVFLADVRLAQMLGLLCDGAVASVLRVEVSGNAVITGDLGGDTWENGPFHTFGSS